MARLNDTRVLGWLYMMRVSDKMHKLSADNVAQFDLSDAQFDVLAHLSAKQGISQQALSDQLFVTKGNVCGLIDRMEARGLVVRQACPVDRRSNLLFLTDEGTALAEKALPSQEAFISEKMSALTDDEQATLRRLMRKLDRSITL